MYNFRLYFLILFALPFQEVMACTGMDYLLDIDNVNCHEGNDGRIEVVPTFIADNLPYRYSLNGSSFTTNPRFTNLEAGSYTLEVRDNNGCVYAHPTSIEITQPDSISLELAHTPIVCGNDAKVFANISGGVGPYLYTWNGDPTLKVDTLRGINDGTFTLEIQDQNNCIATDEITIAPITPFSVNITASETEIQIGDEVLLSSAVEKGSGNFSYQWYPDNDIDCSTCNESSARFFKDTRVRLVVHDLEYGCVATDSLDIQVEGSFSLFIPNAFSPNGDKRNERFLVYGTGVLTATVNIYDKNGFMVYNGEATINGWDGTVSGNSSPEGLYFYHANITYTDGTIRERKGQISLIR